MALIDSYRQNVIRKRDEMTQLRTKSAKERKKIADFSARIQRASEAMRQTKNASTIKSRLNEIERYQKDSARAEDDLAKIESRIAQKDKEILVEEKRLAAEEDKLFKQRNREAEQMRLKNERSMKDIESTLRQHDHYHSETQTALYNLQNLPKKINVVFFASNPLNANHLRLDEEARAITETIRKAAFRDSVELRSCWAVRPEDVIQALNEHTPAIVHFSGHGSDQDEIVFQDDDGKALFVPMEAIVQTMMASSEGIRLVFFNTCHSQNQAEAVVQHVEAAVGMNTSIGDNAARVFASQFYSSIGFGFSVKKAFEQAKGLLMMKGISEQDTPKLFTRFESNPEELIIVKPHTIE